MSGDLTNFHQEGEKSGFERGQWYWVKGAKRDGGDWLGCVMRVGSNYVKLRSPGLRGYHEARVHFDNARKELRAEPDALGVIARQVETWQGKVNALLEEVRALTARLGVAPRATAIDGPPAADAKALVVMSQQVDVKAYEKALVKAKEKQLPDLFKAIEKASEELSDWMSANILPLTAQGEHLKSSIKGIEGRIFNISLYAGLTEEVERIADGEPAPITERLRILQRRLYMDEECLLNYRAGGMVFKKIDEFDEWITQPVNLDRILPFPRCVVSMRVRRYTKDRHAMNAAEAFINFQLEEADKSTFLYIRNGEQVWRLQCAHDFGEMMFPDSGVYDGEQDLMMKVDWRKVDKFMRREEWEVLAEKHRLAHEELERWQKANPKASWIDRPRNLPSGLGDDIYIEGVGHFRPNEWERFTPDSVYFDDGARKIKDEVDAYNRVVLVVQGLLDRSPVLHPHPPINLWRADHLEKHVELIFDGANVLHHGEKPDFEAYRAKLNAMLTTDCVVTGQRDFWMRREAEKMNAKMDRESRGRHHHYRRYAPHGDPGPDLVARPEKMAKAGAAFSWTREGARWDRYERGYKQIPTSLFVPKAELLNVSAYTPGDYLQFFRDVRTRAEYIKWAPLLLAAEDFHAGKTKHHRGQESDILVMETT